MGNENKTTKNLYSGIASLLSMQSQQQGYYYKVDDLTPQEVQSWTDELLLGLYEEVGELSRAIRQKVHVCPERNKTPHSNVVEEVSDVLKYALALASLHSVTPEQLGYTFEAKTRAVEQRFKQRDMAVSHQKVLITDLDGCVADIQPFVEEFGAYGTSIGGIDVEMAKSEWYESGGFLRMDPLSGARECLVRAKSMGYVIGIVTARPVWQHRRVRLDTVSWLEKHDIPHDILVFDKDKYDALIKHVFPAEVVLFVEDRDKHAIELAAHGIPVALINKSYNQTLSPNKYITRVDNWDEIFQLAITNGNNSQETKNG